MKSSIFPKSLLIMGDFNKSKDYVDYNISFLSEKDMEFKCFRRYKFFDMMDTCLINKYPYYAIPKLPEKKLKNILLNTSDREKKLGFYLNYLYNHEELNKTEEFQQFVGEFTFVR